MAFIKTVQLRDIVPVSDILGKLEQVLAGIPLQESSRVGAPVYGSESRAAFPPPPAEKKNSDPLTGKEMARNSGGAPSVPVPVPPVMPAQEAPHHEAAHTAPRRSDLPAQSAPTAAAVNNSAQNKKKDVRLHWQDFTNYVKERKVWMAAALQRAASVRLEKDILTIQYNDRADFRLLNTTENIKPLTEFALDFFQENFRIQFKAPDAAGGVETSGESESGPQRERRDLANESLVRTALEIFNGQIGDIRIGPRFRKPLTRDDEDEFDGSDDHESLS